MDTKEQIEFNITAHDKIAHRYENRHGEIFNDVEQERIRNTLDEVIRAVKSNENSLKALDVGCGSGNLTRHLIGAGIYTVSADISKNFLELIKQNFSATGLSDTLQLDGKNLANIDDNTFDISAAYSVLHHVPDYPCLIKEMCRVLKRGGVIYLDHEKNENFFNKSREYVEFQKSAIPKRTILRKNLQLLLSFSFYIRFIKKRIIPKYRRYRNEGDIHVWQDDHIEWDEIEKLLVSENFEIVKKEDYLVYDSSYSKSVYDFYRDKCTDTSLLIARKS